MLASGSHAGHSVMALRMDGTLYIVESQGAWYWPQAGIQKTPFKQWVQWAKNADFHVVHMPLSAEAKAHVSSGSFTNSLLNSKILSSKSLIDSLAKENIDGGRVQALVK